MEMAGTLMGAAVHGLIVSGAHSPHRCEDADLELPGPATISPGAVSAYADASRSPARPASPAPGCLLNINTFGGEEADPREGAGKGGRRC